MKTFQRTVSALLLAALVACGPMAFGAPAPKYADAGGGTDVSTTLCYSVVSGFSVSGGAPVLTFLNATSDKAASVVQFYTPSNNAAGAVQVYTCTGTNAAGASLQVVSTNGIVPSQVVVIKHEATDTYERRIVSTHTATNIVLTVVTDKVVAEGDKIYPMTLGGFIPCGAATLTVNGNGAGIYAGAAGLPLLFEVDGTSSCQINAWCAAYTAKQPGL